ncbi:MAG: LamG domain-containing protein, partial [Gammaproteobacteria bacterium]
NCWLDSDAACGEILTTWITAWAGETAAGGGRAIELKPPVIKDPGNSKNFPDDSAAFASTVYPLLTEYCSRCHVSSANSPQSPYFASADVNEAYAAVQSKIDLDNPDDSRLVIRLLNEFHNCWSTCSSDANTMLNAVTQFSNGVATTEVDPQLVISKALRLTDGIVANSGGRFESNVIALWEFKTGEGNTAYDTSGVEPAMNLTFNGTVSWVGGWGIQISDGKAQASTSSSKKLHDLITATGEYSIEAWVAPANVTQEGPARIISYSGGTTARNFTLGQTLYNYDFLHRSSTTDPDGMPALSTPDADEALQATLQHVVVTFDGINGRRIFVNGQLVSTQDDTPPGTLSEWDDTFAFVIGNEVSNNRLWQGVVRMAAIHDRALTPEQIQQNYDIGVGQKFYLLFNISNLLA